MRKFRIFFVGKRIFKINPNSFTFIGADKKFFPKTIGYHCLLDPNLLSVKKKKMPNHCSGIINPNCITRCRKW